MAAQDRFDLSDRVAVVTGGTRGLGLAMAYGFAQAGAQVVVVSRKPEACDEVARALRAEGASAAACACHVGHWDRLDGLVEDIYRDFGRIDVLVNNAGVSPQYDKLTDVSEELFDKVIAVNLKGPFRLAALVGERMVEGAGGSIINVSSTGAVRPTRDIVPYAAAKAGVNAMTVGLAHALGPTVRVNAIMPGPFLTTISRAWDMEVFARARPDLPAPACRGGRGDRRRRAVPRQRRVELHDRHDPDGRRRRPVEHGGHRRRRPAANPLNPTHLRITFFPS